MSATTFDLVESSLKARLRRAERMQRLRAGLLVLPLFLFVLLIFLVPIVILMTRAVDNPEIADNLPRTIEALAEWDGADLPGEPVFAAFAEDLRETQKTKNTGLVGKRLNYEISGARSKSLQAGRAAEKMESGPYKEAFLALDPLWGKTETWSAIKRAGSPTTSFYLLKALDLRWSTAGEIERLQRETHESHRQAREQLVSSAAQAREEADRVRTEARAMLDRARAEVAALASRREDITKQLGHLTGVIDALAVPETTGAQHPPPDETAEQPQTEPPAHEPERTHHE